MAGDIPRGRFVWYDLMTSDQAAAEAFYTGLIGWTTQKWEAGPAPYTMWAVGEKAIGGVVTISDEAKQAGVPPHWLAYITTPDIDADLGAAGKRGANTLVPPIEIPTVGRFAVLADPQGAPFSIFQPADNVPGQDDPPNECEFSWHELATTDHEAGWEFYHGLFGWEKTEAMDMGEAGIYQMFRASDLQFPYGGVYNKPPEIPVPNWLLYIRVPNLDEAIERAKSQGGQVLNGPMDVPDGDRVAQCMDPQGAAFALHESKS